MKSRPGIPYHLRVYIISDSSSLPSSLQGLQGQKHSQLLEDILLRLGPITDIYFEPFQPEPKQSVRAILPPTFPSKPYPFDYFSLFFTSELFQTITINTNQYASLQRLYIKEEWARK
jgi:hypothetical protein